MRRRSTGPLRILAPVVLCLSLLAACGSDSDPDADSDPAASASAADAAQTGACTWEASDRPVAKEVAPPAPDAAPAEAVVIEASAGAIPVTLDVEAICATTSFTWLAEQGYYDDSPCHRLGLPEAGYGILQCGDPTGTGTGGPGYSFADELQGDETYPAGTLAMANGGPDTNGSQFFLTYADSGFPPNYTVFGTIQPAGLDVLEQVAEAGTQDGGPDGPPAEPVTIEGIRPAA